MDVSSVPRPMTVTAVRVLVLGSLNTKKLSLQHHDKFFQKSLSLLGLRAALSDSFAPINNSTIKVI